MEHQTLCRWVVRPSDPAYHIEDCQIFELVHQPWKLLLEQHLPLRFELVIISLNDTIRFLLVSVWLWRFSYGGSKLVSSLAHRPYNFQHFKREPSYKFRFWWLLSKSADLSKPWGRFFQIVCVSESPNFTELKKESNYTVLFKKERVVREP